MPLVNRSADIPKFNAGPYLARVISSVDSKYMGTLQVQLLRDVGNSPSGTGSTIQVRYMSPFYGVTGIEHLGANSSVDDTQKSYGFWMIPPDPGTIVVVIFIQGDMRQGFWIGCVQDEYMNFMIPGLAATTAHTDTGSSDKKVVGEYNKRTTTLSNNDATKNKKPIHPFQKILQTQGLARDEVRGITTSSARRESPSNVFGISTPGPIDRTTNAPKGKTGKRESLVTGAFVSRLGGTQFVMDDGDENYLRKSEALDGPPEYASVENNEKGGKPDIPHNELVRIRTRTGHQILLHNSEDLIYIANAKGTAWIELTANGKIDIFATDSVSIHSGNDLNFTADRDINLTAGQNLNIVTGKEIRVAAGKSISTIAGTFVSTNAGTTITENAGTFISSFAGSNITLASQSNTNIMAGGILTVNSVGQLNIESCSTTNVSAVGEVNLKSEGAIKVQTDGKLSFKAASEIALDGTNVAMQSGKAVDAGVPGSASPDSPISPVPAQQTARIPQREPWAEHENLNPQAYKPNKTRAGSSQTSSMANPIPDTFRKNT